MADGWQDASEFLRRLGGRFNRAHAVVYSLDPGINLDSALLNRDGLDILTSATGGRAFASSDLRTAVAQARTDSTLSYLVEYTPITHDSPDHYRTVRITCRKKRRTRP